MRARNSIGYLDVTNQILDMIRSDAMGSGARLPAERELATRWKVGRPTVNKAIACLIAQGHLRREGYKLLVGAAPRDRKIDLTVPPIHVVHPHVGRAALQWVRHGLLEAAHDVAAAFGSHTIPMLYYHLFEQRQFLLQVIQERSAGLMLWPADGSIADLLPQIRSLGIPLVLCDLDMGSGHFVGSDNEAGIGLAMAHLNTLGHRQFAFLSNDTQIVSLRRRVQGYQHACTHLGATPSAKRVTALATSEYEPVRNWLRNLRATEPRVTAVCCSNDRLALPLIRAATKLGLRVPEDLSVVGFDDVEQAATSTPTLTTVAQDFYHIGTTAAQLLFQVMREKTRDIEARPVRLRLEPRLVVRESTARVPPRHANPSAS